MISKPLQVVTLRVLVAVSLFNQQMKARKYTNIDF
jgi:hypothetical protein